MFVPSTSFPAIGADYAQANRVRGRKRFASFLNLTAAICRMDTKNRELRSAPKEMRLVRLLRFGRKPNLTVSFERNPVSTRGPSGPNRSLEPAPASNRSVLAAGGGAVQTGPGCESRGPAGPHFHSGSCRLGGRKRLSPSVPRCSVVTCVSRYSRLPVLQAGTP